MIPYNADTRETYIARCKDNHLAAAQRYPVPNQSMWMQLLFWAMAEDVYGDHWDYINTEEKSNG